ncbi:serine/threonine-protein kinase [Streptomyces sp. SAI-041]|uniref:serine/threonine-protein kinase n=1 Tax=Streptomyces sp. SAI-041 TaxID=2940548 RepID=UPI0024745F59|nr:serine/threonine-protein kinase [Streptomyces sp. SAI-041]MDH6549263.1 serine/threonine protein kinase [Streptomyces sp. SAI-041]
MSEDGEHSADGRLLDGRYRLVGRIGSGPHGTVWRALDEREGRQVAVKELRPGEEAEEEERRRAVQRLAHEARAAARVDDPAAVAIHDVLVDDELPWVVMELVEGESLGSVLASRGPLPGGEAAGIGLAVLGALHAAHGAGIVHRDLKPANVLLEAGTGRVVVTDLGIGGGGRETSAGFLAPECASGPGAGPASDLWSLGAVLRAAVGEAPDAAMEELLDGLLAHEPAARPVAGDVAAVLAGIAGAGVPEWARPTREPHPPLEAAAGAGTVTPPHFAAPASPAPDPPEPRRLTALTALGLLLQKKPERG